MIKGQVKGLSSTESKDLIKNLDNIEGVKCNFYIQENLIEFKSILIPSTPFVIEIAKGVTMGLIVAVILKFFEKNKDKISVTIGDINIIQGDNAQIITKKLTQNFS